MSIRRIDSGSGNWDVGSSGAASEAGAIVFNIKRKKVKMTKSKIKDIAKGMADIAYSLGDTNDPDDLADDMTEDIYEGLSEAERRRKRRG